MQEHGFPGGIRKTAQQDNIHNNYQFYSKCMNELVLRKYLGMFKYSIALQECFSYFVTW